MKITYLDCSAEVSAIQQPANDRMVWLASDIKPDDYLVRLSADTLDEIERLIGFLVDNPLPLLQRKLDELALPACHAAMAQMKSILDDGVGPVFVYVYGTEAQLQPKKFWANPDDLDGFAIMWSYCVALGETGCVGHDPDEGDLIDLTLDMETARSWYGWI